MTAYRTETAPDTVVCAACGEHGLRRETTFTGEGTLVCRPCAATASIEAATSRGFRAGGSEAAPTPVVPPLRRSWGDFLLGALVPVPLYLALAAVLLLVLATAGSSDAPFGAMLGAALSWPVAVAAVAVTARRRFGRISFANGLIVAAIGALAVAAVGTLLVARAMGSGIRG